jgi:hypothetical protein
MRSNGIFTTHQYDIEVVKIGEPIYLIPFGDIHKESYLHDAHHWKKFLDWAGKKKRAYFLGMGDYCEISSATERIVLGNPQLHETTSTRLERFYLDCVGSFEKDIKFMDGKLIGLLEGNHYSMLSNGATTTMELARRMNTKYLGVCSLIRLSFHYKTHNASIDIFAHHGKGGSRLVGAKLNNVQQMAEIARANIYLMGDIHAKVAGDADKFELKHGKGGLRMRKIKEIYARTGSFTKGYVENEPSYVVDSLLNPTNIGVIKIELTPQRECKNNNDEFYIDMHCSI